MLNIKCYRILNLISCLLGFITDLHSGLVDNLIDSSLVYFHSQRHCTGLPCFNIEKRPRHSAAGQFTAIAGFHEISTRRHSIRDGNLRGLIQPVGVLNHISNRVTNLNLLTLSGRPFSLLGIFRFLGRKYPGTNKVNVSFIYLCLPVRQIHKTIIDLLLPRIIRFEAPGTVRYNNISLIKIFKRRNFLRIVKVFD